ncbi:MAG: polysaccharide biosynthesis tyrosine autokinase [Chitinispirillaceae bacterium]|nr:polysaccharide biosynthesis tyrosine autokinase [Chitinispirillaceae bacterium]
MERSVNDNDHIIKQDCSYWIKHFSTCFSRWKRYILLTVPVIFILWFVILSKYNKIQPKIDSNVLIGTYQKIDYSFFPEYSENESVSSIVIKSRNFLINVIDSLRLNFVLSNICRSDVVSYIHLDSSAQKGTYSINVDNSSEHLYTVSLCKPKSRDVTYIESCRLNGKNTLIIPGVEMVLTNEYMNNPFDFKFTIVTKDDAVKELRKNIEIKHISERDPSNQNIIEIVLTGIDPQLSSKTINLIADLYISENIRFLKEKMLKTIGVLENQLVIATNQLIKNEDSIKKFRVKNPHVSLNNNIHEIISGLPVLDNDIFEKNKKLRQASDLEKKLTINNFESRSQAIIEALYFLGSQDVSGAIGLQQYYNYLLQQKFALESNEYAPGHRLVKKNNQKLEQINTKTMLLLNNFIENKKKEIHNVSTEKNAALKNLNHLPEKEMQYAALLRQQLINSELYSQILSNYNQAKMADKSIMSDMYILDYSIPVVPEINIKRLMIYLTSGILLSLLISIGPAIIYDYFDKRLHTIDDLYKFCTAPILDVIPLQKDCKNSSCNKKSSNVHIIDNTQQLKESFLHQTYNKIYSKIDSYLEIRNSKSLLITSYDNDENCSVIAANLAVVAAQKYKLTLLIDSDIRHGQLFDHFKCTKIPGFSDLLHQELALSESNLKETIRYTNVQNLHLLSSGTACKNPTNILLSTQLSELMKMLIVNYKLVIINSPPLSMVSDSYILSREVQSCVIVIKAGKIDSSKINRLINEYPFLKEKILGIILVDSVDTATKSKSFLRYTTGFHANRQLKGVLCEKV